MTSKSNAEVGANTQYSNDYMYKKDFKTALPQILAVSVKNLLLLSYGMTLGFPTILIPAVKNPAVEKQLHLENSEISWISSMNLIVVPIGCALSGVVTAPLGRRKSMQIVNIPIVTAWLLFHFATSTGHLYGALFLTGLSGGLLEAPVLTYAAEITQPHIRGALSATSSMCIILGVFTQFLFGIFLEWRVMALVNITFNIIAVGALCFVPESPHWLISKMRLEDAKRSLQWLRGWTQPHMVQDELNDIQALFKRKKVETETTEVTMKEKLSYYTDRSFLVPYFLVSSAFFVGHFSGMTTLQTYAVTIFQMLEAPIDKYYATLILGVIQLIGSGICIGLVHYTGKRPLTLFSTIGGGICCLLLALYDAYIKPAYPEMFTNTTTSVINNLSGTSENINEINQYSWIPMLLLLLLALITHTGIRLLPWILIGEVFSAKTRSSAAGLSSAVGYLFGFLTNKLFLYMVTTLTIRGTYCMYGFTSLIGAILFYFILPETEGKKLNDIENHFAGIKKLTNSVYKSNRARKDNSTLSKMKGAENLSFETEADCSKL